MSDKDELTRRGEGTSGGDTRIESAKKFLWDEDEDEPLPNTAVTGEANLHGGSGHGYGNDGMSRGGGGGDDYFDKRHHTMNPVVSFFMGIYHIIIGFISLLVEKLCTPTGRKLSLGLVVAVIIVVIATSIGGSDGGGGGGGGSFRIGHAAKRYDAAYEKVQASDIVSDDVLQNTDSAHHKALMWIAKHDKSNIEISHDLFMSRYMLATLYFATVGRDQKDGVAKQAFHNWMSESGVCDWWGITCVTNKLDKDGHGPVKIIDIKESEVGGTLPSGLHILEDLQKLDLSRNKLTGTLPNALLNMTHMEDMFLRINTFAGEFPTMVHDDCKLRQLFLDFNQITGQIPTDLSKCTDLRRLIVEKNALTGTIPTELGELTHLDFFVSIDNELSGNMPTEVCNNVDSGTLKYLFTDCEKVSCSCCQEC